MTYFKNKNIWTVRWEWRRFKLYKVINSLCYENTFVSHLSKNESDIHVIKILECHWVMIRYKHIHLSIGTRWTLKNHKKTGTEIRISEKRTSETMMKYNI